VAKLKKGGVDALRRAHSGRDAVHWDEDLPGFGLRLKPSGATSWVIIQYRNVQGASRRLTLGQVGRLTPDETRKEARTKLSAVDRGADPVHDRSEARQAVTVAERCEDYLKAGKGRIKPSTLENDRSRISAHVLPLLGKKPVATFRPADAEKFLRDVMEGKTAKPCPSTKLLEDRPRALRFAVEARWRAVP
jgi:hypothetical protein